MIPPVGTGEAAPETEGLTATGGVDLSGGGGGPRIGEGPAGGVDRVVGGGCDPP